MKRIKFLSIVPLVLIFLGVSPQEVLAAESNLDTGDTAWILTSTALVLFMTIPGLAFFYAGLVRGKNVLSVLMQCFSLTCLVSVLWIIFLYGLHLEMVVHLIVISEALDF